MDLSINSIKTGKTLNFLGVKGDLDSKNTQVFRFSTSSYKKNEKPYLEIMFLKKKYNDKGIIDSNDYAADFAIREPFNDKTTIEIPQDKVKELGYDAFAYRYVYVNENGEEREALDLSKTISINDQKMNFVEIGSSYGVTPKAGAMYHAFIDSVGYNPQKIDSKAKDFVRTHANKLGGSIKGLTYLLKQGYFDSYKYIISTPDIGADPTSPHKYWPNNQYQCTNLQDFKDFNYELFKLGKGYVADGAFTSQSLQSPLVQHVLKWGKQSPFYYMLKVNDKMQLGVLPESEEAQKNVGIRLLNSPLSKNYNAKKPTLMQFVDDRLLDDAQRADNQKPIDKYGIPNPKDHYDSVGYNDTIHPFYFEIPKDQFDEKLPVFKGQDYIMYKDLSLDEKQKLFEFAGGDLTQRYLAQDATFWDGNVDIVKMNLSNPNQAIKEDVDGFNAAREYLLGVATYWTEAVQSDLLRRTAQLNMDEMFEIAKNGGVTKEEYEAVLDNITKNNFVSPIVENSKTIDTYVSEFPLQSLETSPELSAIFSQPQFNNELLENGTKDIVMDYVKSIIHNAVPYEYKENDEYKEYVKKAYVNEILRTIYAQALLPGSVDENGDIDIEKLRDEATLKYIQSKAFSEPTTAEIERKQVVNYIKTRLRKVDNTLIERKIAKELEHVQLGDFELAESIILQTKSGLNWRFDAAKDIGDLSKTPKNNPSIKFQNLWNGTNQEGGVQNFWEEFVSRIKEYNPASYIIAEITTFGDYYEWLDYDSMMNYDEKLANSFLTNLKRNIDEYGQEQKLIQFANIFADTNQPYNARKDAYNQAQQLIRELNISDKFEVLRDYENNLPWVKEQNFLSQIGASTSSNYDKYFNNISFFVGVDPEHGDEKNAKDNVANINKLKTQTDRLLVNIQPNNTLMSHNFVENHDKPRVLHTLPLDMRLVVAGLNLNTQYRPIKSLEGLAKNQPNLKDTESDEFKQLGVEKQEEIKKKNEEEINRVNALNESQKGVRKEIEDLLGTKDLNAYNPMAMAVGLMYSHKIDELSSLTNEDKEKLHKSLVKLCTGEKNGVPNSYRARAFGFLPYEITIKDLFYGAGIKDESKIEKFNLEVMDEPMYLEDKLWQVLTMLTGVPTIYYGNEYAQTGYETFSKNDLVGNRNRALHERKDNSLFSNFYNKMNAISKLSEDPRLSALRNGFAESLEIAKSGDIEMYPIFRKDERDSQVISVITNFGLKKNTLSKDLGYKFSVPLEPKKVPAIELHNKDNICPLDSGTKLKRMVYSANKKSYITENVNYTIEDSKIVRADGKDIVINDTTALFYVDNKLKSRYMPVYNGAH